MTKTEAQSAILSLVADRGLEVARDLVTEWSNAAEVDIDADGDIWISGPSTGHWLHGEKLSEFAAWAAIQPGGAVPVGTIVNAGEGDDYDTGRVAAPSPEALAIPHAANAVWVAWDSGVSTWTPADLIRVG